MNRRPKKRLTLFQGVYILEIKMTGWSVILIFEAQVPIIVDKDKKRREILDSLILVDFINRARLDGMAPHEAILQSGVARFRPVLLTTITTVGGLVPLAFFASGQAKFPSPMAIAVVWGLSFATILTLILIPCLYAMLDDAKELARRLFRPDADATASHVKR